MKITYTMKTKRAEIVIMISVYVKKHITNRERILVKCLLEMGGTYDYKRQKK